MAITRQGPGQNSLRIYIHKRLNLSDTTQVKRILFLVLILMTCCLALGVGSGLYQKPGYSKLCSPAGRAPASQEISDKELIIKLEEITSLVLALLNLDNRAGCQPEGSRVPSFPTDLKSYLSSQSCNTLFSEKSPRAKATQTNDSWWPVCPAVFNYNALKAAPNLSPFVLDQKVIQLTQVFDLCRPNKTPMRSSSQYVPPTRAQAKVEFTNLEERKATEARFETLKATAVEKCCGSHEMACRHFFLQTKIQWCKPQQDSERPDTCVGTPSYFEPRFSDFPGHIIVSPLKGANGQGLSETYTTLSHELGHACSATRQALSRLHLQYGCNVSYFDKRAYRDLFTRLGGSDSSWRCVKDLAESAPWTRFEPRLPCEHGCQLSHIEEAYADFFAFQNMPSEKIVSDLVPRMCYSSRDTHHPLRLDEMTCFLRTPAIRERMERALQCQR